MAALRRTREHYPERPFSQLPVVLRIIRLVTDLHLNNEFGSGIASILDDNDEHDLGAFVPTARTWLESIGAEVLSQYLARAVALFPKGQVAPIPVERMWQMEAIIERSPEAFEKLDHEYRGWASDLRPAFQRYLEAEQHAITRMLRKGVPEEPARLTVQEILEIADPADCLAELAIAIFISRGEKPKSGVEPEAARMIRVLQEIDLYAGYGDGLWRYLDLGHARGGDLRHAEHWCEQIDASEAAMYLREYRRAFPAARVPENPGKRSAIIQRAHKRFARIDAAHARALPKMRRRLVSYLRSHPEVVESAVGSTAAPRRKGTARKS
jgi:hypothetical protein